MHSFGQGVAKFCGNLARIEDIGAQKDLFSGFAYGREHLRVCLVAIVQGHEFVAAGQVLFREVAADFLHADDVVGDFSGGLENGGWA